jgi:hypothetical protein
MTILEYCHQFSYEKKNIVISFLMKKKEYCHQFSYERKNIVISFLMKKKEYCHQFSYERKNYKDYDGMCLEVNIG